MSIVLKTDIPGARLISRGKVRDIYAAGEHLLLVASDRISAFDVIMNQGIPGKGIVLTQVSKFWFTQTADIVPNHFITDDVSRFPAPFNQYADILYRRSMLVRKARPLPVECIVRGYLAGSGWKEYRTDGTLHKMPLPAGLQNASRLPEPMFTPSTKAESGHDLNISYADMLEMLEPALAENIRAVSLAIYQRGRDIAEKAGIIIADTKFEFGMDENGLLLIDEVMTPDSSRFWPKDLYNPGAAQPSYDKQYLRDYLETLDWGKTPPPPELPQEIIQNTASKYQDIASIFGINLK